MNKQDMINEIICSMMPILEDQQIEHLKDVLYIKLADYDLIEMETSLATRAETNEDVMMRFKVDLLASGREESSIRGYTSVVNKFLNEINKFYQDVTGDDVMRYLAMRQIRDHISMNYKLTTYRYLNAFFTWAYKKKLMPENIMIDTTKPKGSQKPKECLTPDEVAKIRHTVRNDPKKKALVELMLSTGMRISEIIALDIESIDFTQESMMVYQDKTNQYKMCLLTPECKQALINYIGDRKEGAVFVTYNGRASKSTIEKLTKKIGKDAGCHIDTTVHVFRKTFCSTTYKRTHDILLTSKLMGHASCEMTAKYYLVDDIDDLKYRFKKMA